MLHALNLGIIRILWLRPVNVFKKFYAVFMRIKLDQKHISNCSMIVKPSFCYSNSVGMTICFLDILRNNDTKLSKEKTFKL